MKTHEFTVSGLTCDHCVMTVTRAVAEVDGVSSVQIDLVPHGESLVRVDSDSPVDSGTIAEAVEAAGYQLVS